MEIVEVLEDSDPHNHSGTAQKKSTHSVYLHYLHNNTCLIICKLWTKIKATADPESDENLEDGSDGETDVAEDDDEVPVLDELGLVPGSEGLLELDEPDGSGDIAQVQVVVYGPDAEREGERGQQYDETVHHRRAHHVEHAVFWTQKNFKILKFWQCQRQ